MATEYHEINKEGDVTLIMTRYTDEDESEFGNEAVPYTGIKVTTVSARVSSKHLSFASPVLNVLVSSGFHEGVMLQKVGSLTVKLEHDDPDTLLILLKLCHGKVNSLPPKLTLNTFTELAILTDKYILRDFLPDLYIKRWFSTMPCSGPLPVEDMAKWACICSVFKRQKRLDRLCHMMAMNSTGRIRAAHLPIQMALDVIESQRHKARAHCPNISGGACDATVLGSFIRGLTGLGLYPIPEAPYKGVSVSGMTFAVEKLGMTSFCDQRNLEMKVVRDHVGLEMGKYRAPGYEKARKWLQHWQSVILDPMYTTIDLHCQRLIKHQVGEDESFVLEGN